MSLMETFIMELTCLIISFGNYLFCSSENKMVKLTISIITFVLLNIAIYLIYNLIILGGKK